MSNFENSDISIVNDVKENKDEAEPQKIVLTYDNSADLRYSFWQKQKAFPCITYSRGVLDFFTDENGFERSQIAVRTTIETIDQLEKHFVSVKVLLNGEGFTTGTEKGIKRNCVKLFEKDCMILSHQKGYINLIGEALGFTVFGDCVLVFTDLHPEKFEKQLNIMKGLIKTLVGGIEGDKEGIY